MFQINKRHFERQKTRPEILNPLISRGEEHDEARVGVPACEIERLFYPRNE